MHFHCRPPKPVLVTTIDKEDLMRRFEAKEIDITSIWLLNCHHRKLSDADYKVIADKYHQECDQWHKESAERLERLRSEYVKSKGWCLETKVDKEEWMDKLVDGEVKFSDIVELNRQRLLSRDDLEEFRRMAIFILKVKLSERYPQFKQEIKKAEKKVEKEKTFDEKDIKKIMSGCRIIKETTTKVDIKELEQKLIHDEINMKYLYKLNEDELLSSDDLDELEMLIRIKDEGIKFDIKTQVNVEALVRKLVNGEIKCSDIDKMNQDGLVNGEDVVLLRKVDREEDRMCHELFICHELDDEVITTVNLEEVWNKYSSGGIGWWDLYGMNDKGTLSDVDLRAMHRRKVMERHGIKFGFETQNKEELIRKFDSCEIGYYDIKKMNQDGLVSGEDVNEFRHKKYHKMYEDDDNKKKDMRLDKTVTSSVNIKELILKYSNKKIGDKYLRKLNLQKLLSYDDILKIRRLSKFVQKDIKLGFDTKIDKNKLMKQIDNKEIEFSDIYDMNNRELISGEDVYELKEKYFVNYKY